MSEDFDIREEELQSVAQPYLFKLRDVSKLTILLLRHTCVIHRFRGYSFGTSLAEVSCYTVVLNMDIFLTKTHRFASEGLY